MTDPERLKLLIDKLKAGHKLSREERDFVAASQRPPEFFATLNDVAAHYGVHSSALRRWQEKYPEAFTKTDNGYNASAISEARRKFLATGTKTRLNKGDIARANSGKSEAQVPKIEDGETPEVFDDLDTLKARKMTLECQKMTAQIDILMGLYVKKTTVLRELRAVLYGLKEALMRVPAEVCYSVSGKTPAEAQEIVMESIRRVLTKANEIDFARFEAGLDGENGVLAGNTRLPPARETNGRQAAPK